MMKIMLKDEYTCVHVLVIEKLTRTEFREKRRMSTV